MEEGQGAGGARRGGGAGGRRRTEVEGRPQHGGGGAGGGDGGGHGELGGARRRAAHARGTARREGAEQNARGATGREQSSTYGGDGEGTASTGSTSPASSSPRSPEAFSSICQSWATKRPSPALKQAFATGWNHQPVPKGYWYRLVAPTGSKGLF